MKFEEEYTSNKRERSQQIAEKYRRNAARRSGAASGAAGRTGTTARTGGSGAAGQRPAAGTSSGRTPSSGAAGAGGRTGSAASPQRPKRPSSRPAMRRQDEAEENSAPLLPSREVVAALVQDRRVQIGALILAALLMLFLVSRLFAIGGGGPRATAAPETTTETPAETTTEEVTTTEEETEAPLGFFEDTGVPAVALTFDDGPGADSTNRILDVMEKYNAHATFFIQGQSVSGNPDALVRMINLGCELGNHTWDHKKLTTISASERAQEYSKTINAIREASGGYEPTVFRPPYGSSDKEIRAEIDVPVIIWSLDSLDWKSRNASAIIQEIRSQIKGGDIILLHDIHDSTADAVEQLVPLLQQELGYKLLTVTELYQYYGEPLTLHMGHAYAELVPSTAAPTEEAAETSAAAVDPEASGESAVETTAAEGE